MTELIKNTTPHGDHEGRYCINCSECRWEAIPVIVKIKVATRVMAVKEVLTARSMEQQTTLECDSVFDPVLDDVLL